MQKTGNIHTLNRASYRNLVSAVPTLEQNRHQGYFSPMGGIVTGFLPHRSPTNMLYALQVQLEQALGRQHGVTLGGLTLDLQKAFNNIPRRPCREILLKLGVDPVLVHCWFTSLKRMRRSWQIQGQLYDMPETVTGVPEGDQWSVLCMLAINRILSFLVALEFPTVAMHLFADNWSYHSDSAEVHDPMVELLQRFTQMLHIPIDWSKTFCWATCPVHTAAWNTVRLQHPFTQDLCQVANARDLGIIMHFRCKMTRGTQKERHAQSLQRLTPASTSKSGLQNQGRDHSSCMSH